MRHCRLLPGVRFALPLLALALGASSALAQGWVVDASAGGTEHDPVAATVGTQNAILGVRYEEIPWFYLSLGAPLDSGGLPWGAGGLGTRLERSRSGVGFGADLAAHLFGYRDPALDAAGTGGIVEAVPFVALTRGGARLELQSGLLHYRSSFDGVTVIEQTLHHNAARLSYLPTADLRLIGEARLARVDEGDFPFVGAAAELALPRGEVWAHFGRWLSDDMTTPIWSIGGSARVTERIRLRASYEQESEDPLYWNLPRRSWSIGVSRSLGPRRAPLHSAPVAAQVVEGSVIIRLPLSEADTPPAIAGDFNEWKPARMTRSPDGWVFTLALPPGVYRYAFQRADGTWFVPDSFPNRVDDGFGGHSAVLIVPASPGS